MAAVGRRWLLLAVSLAMLCPMAASAAPPYFGRKSPMKADTSRSARDEAVETIPFSALDEAARSKVDSVLADTAVYRRLPVQVIRCDPEMYLFLVEHPDVLVSIWEVFGITQLAVHEVGQDTFRVSEAAGTRGTMELLYASQDTHVFYGEGRCEGPVLSRPISGRVLAVLKSGYVRQPDGRDYVTCRLDAFLQVDRAGVELVTKTLQPMVGHVADFNFAQTAAFIGSLSRTAETNPGGVSRLAARLTEVQPTVRERFAELAEQVADRATHTAAQADETDVAEHPAVVGLR